MASFRSHRGLWILLVAVAVGTVLLYAAQQLLTTNPDHLGHAVVVMSRWRQFLESYGFWLHLGTHGATYLYLILNWSQLVCWVDQRRAVRGYMPLSLIEQRRLMWAVVAVCVVYESLLMLRYLD